MAKKKEFDEEATEVNLDLKDEPPAEKGEGDFGEDLLELSEEVPVKLSCVLGQKNMVLKDLLKFKVGQTLDLDRPPNEFVDLMANGKVVARGELVEIDGKLGVRIIKLLKG